MKLAERIIEDLRDQANFWNGRSMVQGASDDVKRTCRKLHEELRRMANRYEKWNELDGTF